MNVRPAKKIRLKLDALCKARPGTRKIVWKLYYAYRKTRYAFDSFGQTRDEHLILFESFGGRSYSDSPRAIYEAILCDERFADYKFIWCFKDKTPNEKIKENTPLQDPRTICLHWGGRRYRKSLARAKYWVTNFKPADYLFPKKDQLLLQTWHGTPLKRLGCDLEHFDTASGGNMDEMKMRYRMEASKISYFVAPSKFTAEKIVSAWALDESGQTEIVHETGYPRNDFLTKYTQEDVQRIKLKILGYWFVAHERDVRKKKIILYTPTYRPNFHEVGKGYVYQEEIDFKKFREKLGDDYVVLFRAHYIVANSFNFDEYEGFVYDVSKVDDINELYIISDMLITDYSSTLFDYAILKKPMIFYMYDLDHYENKSNGFYFDVHELPGPIVKTDDELVDEILKLPDKYEIDEKYQKFLDQFDYLEDGHSTERVIEGSLAKWCKV